MDSEMIEWMGWGITFGLVAFFTALGLAAPFAAFTRISR